MTISVVINDDYGRIINFLHTFSDLQTYVIFLFCNLFFLSGKILVDIIILSMGQNDLIGLCYFGLYAFCLYWIFVFIYLRCMTRTARQYL